MDKVRKPSNSVCYTPSSEPYRIYNYWFSDFDHHPVLKIRNTTFRKMYLFPSSGEGETPAMLGCLESANLNHWTTHVKEKVNVTLRLAVYRQLVSLGAKPIETHDKRFFLLNPCGHSPYVTPCLTGRWVCLLWIHVCLTFRQMYVSDM
jgi:hypothetical protein